MSHKRWVTGFLDLCELICNIILTVFLTVLFVLRHLLNGNIILVFPIELNFQRSTFSHGIQKVNLFNKSFLFTDAAFELEYHYRMINIQYLEIFV